MKEIKYNKQCRCLGRNGISIQAGISIDEEQRIDQNNKPFKCVTFTPVNSKGNLTIALQSIPVENIPELIQHLKQVYDNTYRRTTV